VLWVYAAAIDIRVGACALLVRRALDAGLTGSAMVLADRGVDASLGSDSPEADRWRAAMKAPVTAILINDDTASRFLAGALTDALFQRAGAAAVTLLATSDDVRVMAPRYGVNLSRFIGRLPPSNILTDRPRARPSRSPPARPT
jgi:hypothetical protein